MPQGAGGAGHELAGFLGLAALSLLRVLTVLLSVAQQCRQILLSYNFFI
jgi:hypothetical protein